MVNIIAAMVNVPNKVGVNGYEKCWTLASEEAPFFGINENFSKRQKRTYIRMAREHGFSQFGTFKGPNPIFWDKKKYKKRWGSQHLLHGRGPKYNQWPGFNDRRYATVVVLEDLINENSPDVAVINTHLLYPARGKVPAVWGRRARTRALRLLRDIVREHLEAGRIVILMGDMNMRLPFWVHRQFKWIKGSGIDKIGIAVPKGYKISKKMSSIFRAPTDHKYGVRGAATVTK